MKNLLKEWKYDIICFPEIKLDSLNSVVVKSLWCSPFINWAVLNADHTAGGCLVGLG